MLWIRQIVQFADGKLGSRKAVRLERLSWQDPSLRALIEEQRRIRRLLASYNPETSLPISPERYWWEVRSRLQLAEVDKRAKFVSGVLRSKWIATAVAVFTVILLAMWVLHIERTERELLAPAYAEIESTAEDGGTITFRSELAGMTVVWLDYE